MHLDKNNTWIIDPIDGTTNFLHGIPHFAISIALKCDEIVSGLISGPMTKNVIDNMIVFNSIMGYDENDNYSRKKINIEFEKIKNASLTGKRFGVFKSLLREPIYKKAIKDIKEAGGIIIEFDPPKIDYISIRASSMAINEKMLEKLNNF